MSRKVRFSAPSLRERESKRWLITERHGPESAWESGNWTIPASQIRSPKSQVGRPEVVAHSNLRFRISALRCRNRPISISPLGMHHPRIVLRLPKPQFHNGPMKTCIFAAVCMLGVACLALAQQAPFVPQPVVQGGQIYSLFPPGSRYLNNNRIGETEQNNIQRGVPGRIQSIVNIHNPSIEVHTVDPGINTGTVVILAAGGGHETLNVGTEGADFVPFFYNYGVNTVILRNRLRRDGYNPLTDEIYDAQQAIRMVRAHAQEWGFDPNKIGIIGFSAGAELAAPAAVMFDKFDQANNDPSDPLAGVSSRPDFVGLVYPGPTPFA